MAPARPPVAPVVTAGPVSIDDLAAASERVRRIENLVFWSHHGTDEESRRRAQRELDVVLSGWRAER